MALATTGETVDDLASGRSAADRLANDWDDRDWVPSSPSAAWARAAVARFGEIMAEQPSIFRASLKRADKGASTLSPRPFQGILECLQNADDLGATVLRVAYRDKGRQELLIVHDGESVTFANVGAMLLPWLSTKEGDADAAGRFGIGQRTLNALGGPIELHAPPFHLVMTTDGPVACDPEPDIVDHYDGARRDTMLVIPLSPKVTSERVAAAVAELGADSLLFLRSVRELSYSHLEDPTADLRFAVEVDRVDQGTIEFDGAAAAVQIDDIKVVADGDGSPQGDAPSFRRYTTQRPVPAGQVRANKETGASTPLGACVSLAARTPRGLYDRMPLPTATGLTVGLNAQFDPDAARSTLMPNEWNLARLGDLGQLAAWAALHAFDRDVASGWTHVPLASEASGDDDWIDAAVLEHIVDASHAALRERLEVQVGAERVPLAGLAFEAEALEPLLTEADVEAIVPEAAALPRGARDPGGRWRAVLGELGGPQVVDVADALAIIDGDPARGAEWYVGFAALAHSANLVHGFLSRTSILLADGTTTAGPQGLEPWVLVRDASPAALAPRLGLARMINPAYLVPEAPAGGFVAALERSGLLFASRDDATDVFAILARGAAEGVDGQPIRLEDSDLLALRDAWESLPRQRRLELGPRIGRSVAIRSTWIDDDGTRRTGWDRPTDLYLPVAIDRDVDSFAKAAGRTPNLRWTDPAYAKLLKQAAGRSATGAQKLLSAWGVAREPRLIRPTDEATHYVRDLTLVSPVDSSMRTADHMASIRSGGHYTHLVDDHWSPDADAVADHIALGPAKTSRPRAFALIGVLSRGWDKRYAEVATASPAWAYNGWNRGSEVRATWLARLADKRWMPDAGNGLQRPCDLQLQTPGSPPRPSDRSSTIARLDSQVVRSGLLTALGVRAGPSQADLIARLRVLRNAPPTPAVTDEVLATYQLLSASLRDRSDAGPDERLPAAKFRNAFRAGPNEAGLLLVDGQWLSPEAALRGPPVLGARRPFAPHVDGLEPLWKALGVRLPTAADAIPVLKEIASSGAPSKLDQGIVIRALGIVADGVAGMTAQLRTTLRRLPLWTGTGWTTARPLYAVEGEALLASAPPEMPVWRPGLSSFSSLEPLLEPLGIVRLSPSDFRIASLPAYGLAEGEELRPTYAAAMALLRQELARADQKLLDGLTVDWDELLAAPVLIDPELTITAELDTGPIRLPARAHIARDPLCLVVRSLVDAASAEAAGAAIGSLFDGDRQKAGWAWAAVWPRANAGEQADGAVLPKTRADRGKGSDRLTQLAQQAAKRTRTKKESAKSAAKSDSETKPVQVRRLRDVGMLSPSAGVIVNKGAEPTGNPIVAKRRTKQKNRSFSPGHPGTGGGSGPRTVLPPASDREKVALEAVRSALALDVEQFNDLRAARGVGVDAIDELRQCYEIKMCSGATMPTDVTLTASEIIAARDDEDFFLAIVTGLEEGAGKLRVRFIFDPLEQLDIRVRSDLTLTGVDKAEALEFEFDDAGEAG